MADELNNDNQGLDGSGGNPDNTGTSGTNVMDAFNGAKQGENTDGNQGNSNANGDNANSGKSEPDNSNVQTLAGANEGIELKAWGAQLSKEIKENQDAVKALSQFDDISALASKYLELAKKGNMSGIPAEDATDEEVQEFYKKLGKPEAVDKYSFDQKTEAEKELANIAFTSNLSDAQAKSVYEFIQKQGEKQMKAFQEGIKQQAMATDAAIKKEFGNLADEKLSSYTKGLKVFANNKELISQFEKTGLAYNEHFVRMFIKIGEALGESKFVGGDGKDSENQIKSMSDGGTLSFFN